VDGRQSGEHRLDVVGVGGDELAAVLLRQADALVADRVRLDPGVVEDAGGVVAGLLDRLPLPPLGHEV
jgi:hypothetical protein